MNEALHTKVCKPCEEGGDPLTSEEIHTLLPQINNWAVLGDAKLEKIFHFNNFTEALQFVNAIGAIAEQEGHHPDILIYGWNKVRLTLYTHAVRGLSENDFILAAKIDKM